MSVPPSLSERGKFITYLPSPYDFGWNTDGVIQRMDARIGIGLLMRRIELLDAKLDAILHVLHVDSLKRKDIMFSGWERREWEEYKDAIKPDVFKTAAEEQRVDFEGSVEEDG